MSESVRNVTFASAPVPVRWRAWSAIGALVLWIGLAAAAHAGGHAVEKSLPDLVAEAERIELARLEAARPRWNARGNLILTDYRFRRERDLLGDAPAGEAFDLTQGGGVIGEEGHGISGNPALEIGARYLLFVMPDRSEMFAPFVGGEQGVFRIDGDGLATSADGARQLHVDELLSAIEPLLRERAGAPPRRPASMHSGDYPAKRYVPPHIARPHDAPVTAGVAPRDSAPAAAPGAPAQPMSMHEPDRGVEAPSASPWAPRYSYGATTPFPVVYDELPHDWAWSPHDQYQMSHWNSYLNGALFLISNSELGTWAWGNNRFELVGWPSNADMINQFGEGWGADTLAITYSRWNTSTNVILEADIAFNPAFCWTLSEFEGADPANTCWNFQQTMLHELGHGWGLDHPWESQDVWWDSVMNYAPKAYRQIRLNTDDVNAARARYGGPGLAATLISQWRTEDNAGSMHASYVAALPLSTTVRHGQDLSLSGPFQIENLGTGNFVDPVVELYLTQNWNDWNAPYVYLRTANYTSTLGPFSTFTFNVNPTTVSSAVPTGVYYLTLWLDNGSGSTRNQTSSSNPDTKVTIRNDETTLSPQESWQLAETGRIGPSGVWDFRLPTTAGRTYEFTTCADGGGSADFDTVIEIVGVTYNDDYCGYQSRLLWTAPGTGWQTVRVRGYDLASQGTFLMAYREVVSDRIFAGGFQ